MGIEFRDGRYTRRVWIGKRTIKEGEGAVIWRRSGRCKEVIGPALCRLHFSTIRFLTRHTARPGQYIVIYKKTGEIEHLVGPATLYENPVKYISVQVCDGIKLESPQDCLVVTTHRANTAVAASKPPREVASSKSSMPDPEEYIERRIVKGPAQFVPRVNETVVDLQWTSIDQELSEGEPLLKSTITTVNLRPFRMKVKTALTTQDGGVFTIRLNIGCRIGNIDTAIDFADPIGAMWQALVADLARIGAATDSAQTCTVLEGVDALNSLRSTATSVGMIILDVQVQGVTRPRAVQEEMNRRKHAVSAHAAAMEDATRAAEIARITAETKLKQASQAEQVAAVEFETNRRAEMHEFELNSAKQNHRLELEAIAREASDKAARDKNKILTEFLEKLGTMGVDLTKYLCSMGELREGDLRQQVAMATGLDINTALPVVLGDSATPSASRPRRTLPNRGPTPK
eukprot:m.145243 g.145243  ORF g.145243 m.145243 type:complete len:459 (+) comp17729_c0_seq1:279-1655(+)